MRITVLDVNDNRPAFGRVYYSLEVPENLEPVTLFTLRATDLDSGDSGLVQYRITGNGPVSLSLGCDGVFKCIIPNLRLW